MTKNNLVSRLAVLLITILTASAWGQDCHLSISGRVSDPHLEGNLSNTTVTLFESSKQVITDEEGNYRFDNLCPGNYTLIAEHPNCTPQQVLLVLEDNRQLDFNLEHHINALNEVTVSGKSYFNKSDTGIEETISIDDIKQQSSKSFGDLLSQISGVTSLKTGNAIAKPIINGLHSSRVLIINSGVKMEDQEWGSEHAPNIDVNSAGNIQVIKGASALQYGGSAVGGIIVTEPEKIAFKDSVYGNTMIGGVSNGNGGFINSALVFSKKTGFNTKLQSQYKKIGDVHSPDYQLSNTGLEQKSFSLSIEKKGLKNGISTYLSFIDNQIGILKASHIGAAEDQLRAIESDVPLIVEPFSYRIQFPRQEVQHQLLKVNAYHNFVSKGKLEFQYDIQNNKRKEFDLRRTTNKNVPALDLALLSESLTIDFDSYRQNNLDYKIGIAAAYQNNYANPDTGVKRLIPDYEKLGIGSYGILHYELSPTIGMEWGVRYDYTYLNAYKFYQTSFWNERSYDSSHSDLVLSSNELQTLTHPQLHFSALSYSYGMHFDLGLNTTVLLNLSHASRAPNPSELFSEGLHHSASRIEIGDLNFQMEKSTKILANIEHHSNRLSYTLQPYYQPINNFIVLEPKDVEQTIRGYYQRWEYRQTKALLYGLDFDLNVAITNFLTYKNQFSTVIGNDLSIDKPLIHMPPLQLINGVTFSKNKYVFTVESQFVAKQNKYPNHNFEVYLPTQETYKAIDLSSTPKAYSLLSIHGEIPLKSQGNTTSSLSINIDNALNKRYRSYLNSLRYYADEMGRNITVQYLLKY